MSGNIETIHSILDGLDAQLEQDISDAEHDPILHGSFPGQTRELIAGFQELLMDMEATA